MFKRIITAIIGVAVLVPMFMFSDTLVLNLYICLCTVLSTYELLSCTGYIKKYAISIPAFIFALLMPIVARSSVLFRDGFLSGKETVTMFSLAVLFFFVTVTSTVFSKGKFEVTESVFVSSTCIYIVGSFCTVILLCDIANGKYLYPLIFLTAWGSDIFAYFVGKAFGKHKLCPTVSPKKTVEGSIGGVLGNILFFVLYAYFVSKGLKTTPNYIALSVVAIVTSLISQVGDLFMSLIKRKYGLKDFGKLLPGHGGVLDRFDSFIAVSPFLYLMCSTFFVVF